TESQRNESSRFILDYQFLGAINDLATTATYPLSLHDALPVFRRPARCASAAWAMRASPSSPATARATRCRRTGRTTAPTCTPCRSEEHTSEHQSRENLVCRLLLERINSTKTS